MFLDTKSMALTSADSQTNIYSMIYRTTAWWKWLLHQITAEAKLLIFIPLAGEVTIFLVSERSHNPKKLKATLFFGRTLPLSILKQRSVITEAIQPWNENNSSVFCLNLCPIAIIHNNNVVFIPSSSFTPSLSVYPSTGIGGPQFPNWSPEL